jgi:hypothetical protein
MGCCLKHCTVAILFDENNHQHTHVQPDHTSSVYNNHPDANIHLVHCLHKFGAADVYVMDCKQQKGLDSEGNIEAVLSQHVIGISDASFAKLCCIQR